MTLLLVRKPTPSAPTCPGKPDGRPVRYFNDRPTRIDVSLALRLWIMQAFLANASCHLGVARILSMPERLCRWIGINIGTRWWLIVVSIQIREFVRQTVRWPILSLLPCRPALSGISVSVDYSTSAYILSSTRIASDSAQIDVFAFCNAIYG